MANGYGSTGANIIMQQQIPAGASTWQQALGGIAQGLMAGYLTRSEREQALAAKQQEYQMEMTKAQAMADAQFKRDRELKMLDLESARETKIGDRGFEMEKLGKQHEYKLNEQQQSLLMDLQKLQTGKALDAQYAPSIAGASEAARLAAQERYGVGKGAEIDKDAKQHVREAMELQQFINIAKPAIERSGGSGGMFGGVKGVANRAMSALGVASPEQQQELADWARVDATVPSIAMAARKPGMGPMTDKDMEIFLKTAPSRGKTREENIAAIAVMQELINNKLAAYGNPQSPMQAVNNTTPQQMPAQPQTQATTTEGIPPLDHLSTEQLQALRARLAGGR